MLKPEPVVWVWVYCGYRHEPDTIFSDLNDVEEEWNFVLMDMEEEVDKEFYGHLGDGPTTVAER
ncbi:hypothetical protein SCLCIDRAFT_34173 [Scleroderma citrinum Foug A]|uniref:Uncharacterized protein n=1 Tax=Scleroderma citrinum Foug A TaxID=1036808 RepID=A0A0C3D363_9AGAM|nr:hypothetical protein SCLCIDRAFT_34173 [Scleroderma citrinum Foug A]